MHISLSWSCVLWLCSQGMGQLSAMQLARLLWALAGLPCCQAAALRGPAGNDHLSAVLTATVTICVALLNAPLSFADSRAVSEPSESHTELSAGFAAVSGNVSVLASSGPSALAGPTLIPVAGPNRQIRCGQSHVHGNCMENIPVLNKKLCTIKGNCS